MKDPVRAVDVVANEKALKTLVLGVAALFAAPFLYQGLFVRALNHDIFWLVTAAGRMIGGDSLLSGAYEPNPPLSILIYIPHYILWRVTHFPLEHIVVVVTISLAVMAAALSARIVKSFPFLDEHDSYFFGILFALAAIVAPGSDFGQRDHLLVLALVPLLLAQAALTFGRLAPRKCLVVAVAAGAAGIFLKPYYAVFPGILILYRVAKNKKFSVNENPDVAWLAAAGLFYVVSIFIFFRDYMTHIFPDVLLLYGDSSRHLVDTGRISLVLAGFCAVGVGTAGILPVVEEKKKFALCLFLAAALCLIPYRAMNMGFSYHLVPMKVLLSIAAGMTVFFAIRTKWNRAFLRASVAAMLAAVALSVFVLPRPYYPSRADVMEKPLTKAVAACGEGCSFALFGESVRLAQLTAYYSGRDHASRFPMLWFIRGVRKHEGEPRYDALRSRYADYVSEDLARFRPQMVLVCDYNGLGILDFLDAKDSPFSGEWAHYRADGSVYADESSYYSSGRKQEGNGKSCEIYRRGP